MVKEEFTCAICGTDMKRFFSQVGDWQRHESKNRNFEVWRCPRDGFARVAPLPSTEELWQHYDFEQYYTRGVPNSVQRMTLVGRLVEKAAISLGPRPFGRGTYIDGLDREAGVVLLDIGCGAGKLLRKAAGLGHKTYGVEPDENAESRQPDFELPVFEGTAENLPPTILERKYDAVVMVHVLEHVTDPLKTFENLYDLLKPGGTAYIEVPNCAAWDAKLAKLSWPHLEIPRHLNFWTADTLSQIAEKKGFFVERISHVGYVRQFGASWKQKGQEIAKYHSDAPWYRRLRGWPELYVIGLFFLTLFSPARRKFDSAVIVIKRENEN